ncbi:MAG TPA: hypothetical protein VM597_27270 [Gemmataceae bacterium]|nr:hypothetical protein [Gemmataceae bacterium]
MYPRRFYFAFLLPFVFCVGCIGGGCAGTSGTSYSYTEPYYDTLPHHVARTPDALSFRFAMVHDVVHERFPKHGPAFYRERDHRARAKLATLPPDSDEALALLDDIGAGLDRLGRPDEAVPLLRDKLDRQARRGLSGRALYTTYANLGTFLIHTNMKEAASGDATARAKVEEGRELIRRSIEVNPDAHFGREEWQLVAATSFLAFAKEPELLRAYDLIGNRLSRQIIIPDTVLQEWEIVDLDESLGRPFKYVWPARRRFEDPVDRGRVREYIARVGGEALPLFHAIVGRVAPFDEPCLGMIGMWRQGGGANPHFALSLGEIMLRVGQRYLAWSCYERASRLSDRFWPKPELQTFLRDHCAKRQHAIEQTLPAEEVPNLRPKFEAEMAYGERFQAEYQAFEAAKIAAGADIDDPKFFDDFHAGREPIASRPGPEEWYAGGRVRYTMDRIVSQFLSWGLLTGGTLVFFVGLALTWLDRRHVTLKPTEVPSPTPPPPPLSPGP